MNTSTSDAATSTDDIVKGRPLCLFYFAHPFGVLSCEPPTVLAPAPPAPASAPAPTSASGMAKRSPKWPAGACARRLPPFTRTLPPLKLPTPKDSSSLDGSDVWSRSSFVPPDKMSLPPIDLPTPTRTPTPSAVSEVRAPRARRLGPVGVRKSGARSRGAAIARLLRRAVATGGAGVDRSPRSVRGALATVRAAWQPAPSPPPSPHPALPPPLAPATPEDARACTCSPLRSESNTSTVEQSIEGVTASEGGRGWYAGGGAMSPPPRATPAPLLLHRRYSVPETVMRRYRLAREQSEAEEESLPALSPSAAAAAWCAPRELVRRSALLRRAVRSPCRCDARSPTAATGTRRHPRSPLLALQPPSASNMVAAGDIICVDPSPSLELLEIVISETTPPVPFVPTRNPASRSIDCNINIDEYVSNILVDSLNSLTDRLENMTVSIGGAESKISVVEKEIKVKLQNKGVNTVVHLSPTSNNQIIFGNREICERDPMSAVDPLPAEQLFCDELEVSAESWCAAPPRTVSPCASLVDSLDDPMSPRAAPPPPHQLPPTTPPPPAPPSSPPPSDLHLTPLSSVQSDNEKKCESFFVPMSEDDCACEKENIVVADHMPEKIKQRLYRRHRRREMRAQGVRRGAARRNAQRDIQRQCAALVDSLVEDAIARVAREEYRCARIAQRRTNLTPNENILRTRYYNGRNNTSKALTETQARVDTKRTCHVLESPLQAQERVPPRRLYHKSEIHDGGKCIEILEIVEYANSSRSSSETNSDESVNTTRNRKSRIPIPIQSDKGEVSRVRRASVASSTPAPSPTPTPAAGSSAASRRASVPATEHCAPTCALRFDTVFDVIPEERSSVSMDSAGEEGRSPAPATPARRSAATSPFVPPGPTKGFVDCVSSRKTHTRRSVGTQWTRVQAPLIASERMSEEESALLEEMRSSSECERESMSEIRGAAPLARRRARAAPRARPGRRAPRPPPPPSQPPHSILADDPTVTAQEPAAPPTVTNSGGEGWSLTLAGSCRAALPSRLDLRLRFPTQGAAAAHPPAPPTRSDSTTDRFSDLGSQDREWSTCKLSSVKQRTQAAPAIRYNSTGTSAGGESGAGRVVRAGGAGGGGGAAGLRRGRRGRGGGAAEYELLPALGAPPTRKTQLQERSAPCQCWAAAGDSRAATGARHGASPRPSCSPPPRLDRLHQSKPHSNKEEGSQMQAAAAALAVLGCAIVPERRAAPPTASQRDLARALRAQHRPRPRPNPRPRRHSVATTTLDNTIRSLCYS